MLNSRRTAGTLAMVIACGMLIAASGQQDSAPVTHGAPARPNILLIVADDLGYSDLSVFGSEIQTPNIDRLAASGTILTNFYTAPLCAPTRAMLMSGTDHHRAGEGLMDVPVEGAPGYEGHLNRRVVSVATRLNSAGYHTYMTGKWHLGNAEDESPTSRGFERSFTLLDGAADHFSIMGLMGGKAHYRDDGKLLDELPKNFYSTITYTDKMLEYLKSNAHDSKPFFAYLAYTAPHWPAQAPAADIDKQRGRYDAGYEVLRQQRFEAWKAKGFAPKDAQLPNVSPDYKPWATLSKEERARSSRTMEVYAAMVERMDSEIGRVMKYLEESGQLANTLIVFESDNGAEGMRLPSRDTVEQIGHPGSSNSIGREWAQAGAAAYFLQKYWATEGGIHVPAIVRAPLLGVPAGVRNDAVLIASDVAPTLLELAGVDPAAPQKQADALPITGRSFLKTLRGDGSVKRGPSDTLGWEHGGEAAIRKGDWKLVWIGPGPKIGGVSMDPVAGPPPRLPDASGGAARPAKGAVPGAPITRESIDAGAPRGAPIGTGGPWRLFSMRADPGELHDLAAQHPEIVKDLMAEWDRYVTDNGVIVKRGDGK